MKTVQIQTHSKEELLDITSVVQKEIYSSGVQNGICMIYVPHTTAGVTINENADPSVKEDILMTLRKSVPDSLAYSHAEGNSPAHVKSCLVGASSLLVIEAGKLALGTWQGIFFCEFDGPRKRTLLVKILSS
jgi:secondary thiamine-phosphate synthase enzyme